MIRKITYAMAVALALASFVSAETFESLRHDVDGIKKGQDAVALKVPVQATELSVTNGQSVKLSAGVNLLRSEGSANNATNAITLLAPLSAGSVFYVVNVGTSNQLSLAETGTWLSDALVISVDTGYTILSVSDNAFRKF